MVNSSSRDGRPRREPSGTAGRRACTLTGSVPAVRDSLIAAAGGSSRIAEMGLDANLASHGIRVERRETSGHVRVGCVRKGAHLLEVHAERDRAGVRHTSVEQSGAARARALGRRAGPEVGDSVPIARTVRHAPHCWSSQVCRAVPLKAPQRWLRQSFRPAHDAFERHASSSVQQVEVRHRSHGRNMNSLAICAQVLPNKVPCGHVWAPPEPPVPNVPPVEPPTPALPALPPAPARPATPPRPPLPARPAAPLLPPRPTAPLPPPRPTLPPLPIDPASAAEPSVCRSVMPPHAPAASEIATNSTELLVIRYLPSVSQGRARQVTRAPSANLHQAVRSASPRSGPVNRRQNRTPRRRKPRRRRLRRPGRKRFRTYSRNTSGIRRRGLARTVR